MGLPDGTSAGSAEPKRETLALKETLDSATPGPWSWMGGYPQRITNPGAILVAETFTDPDSRAHNAELIALAPELAALVLDMGEELRRSLPQDESMDHGRDPDRRALLARLAQLGKEQR